jgi:hypothetical protein
LTQSSYRNGLTLPKAPRDKRAFISFIERKISLPSNCSVIDLDTPSNIQTITEADLGIWLNWNNYIDGLGPRDDCQEGVERARDLLFLISCRFPNLIFSADTSRPPLDHYGQPWFVLKWLFNTSTCYSKIEPVAIYKSHIVYWGSQPSLQWTDDECITKDIRQIRLKLERLI